MRSVRADTVAAILLFLAAILFGGIWYLYLFTAPLPGKSVIESAQYAIHHVLTTESEYRAKFIWLAILPMTCIALAVAYLSNIATSKGRAILLFLFTLILAVITFIVADPALAVFVALPGVWGYRCVRGA